jgi:hypothetical protein
LLRLPLPRDNARSPACIMTLPVFRPVWCRRHRWWREGAARASPKQGRARPVAGRRTVRMRGSGRQGGNSRVFACCLPDIRSRRECKIMLQVRSMPLGISGYGPLSLPAPDIGRGFSCGVNVVANPYYARPQAFAPQPVRPPSRGTVPVTR